MLDGFGSHTNNLPANQLRYDNKILSLKEEGDSSHVNQAYDRLTAKSDKHIHRKSLAYLSQDKRYNSQLINQTDLVHCGLACVRHTRDNPDIWEKSYIATNTKPSDMMPFAEFCKKIEGHLTGSDSYEISQAVDKYSLLPSFWQAMEPAMKRKAVEIVTKYEGNAWKIDCVMELHRALSIPLGELPSLQPCIVCAIEDPSHLDRGFEEDAPTAPVPDEITEVEENRKTANDGLTLYMRDPPGVTGLPLFEHHVEHLRWRYTHREKEFGISKHLDVVVKDDEQRSLLTMSDVDRAKGLLMFELNEGGASLRKTAKRRLDNLGQIKSFSSFINNPERLQAMKHRLELQMSIGHAAEIAEKQAAKKKSKTLGELESEVPKAIELFLGGKIKAKAFTIKCISALLSLVFKVDIPSTIKKKDALIEFLNAKHSEHPNVLEEARAKYAAQIEAAPPVPPLPPTATTPPPASDASEHDSNHAAMSPNFFGDKNESDSESDDPIPAPDGSYSRWLYSHAAKEVGNLAGFVQITALELSLLVIQCIEKARGDKERYARKSAFTQLLSKTLAEKDRYLKFLISFINPIAEKVQDLVNDEGLNEKGIRDIIS